ncbi:hypothetical protein AK812_SmicGene36693 [Symbiodinium microadriaticum]|uniref:Uncharacterized protein n=1 Tax=Symbiodinium microadriaticum TaxID=2951 RepID=A0A1Q9CI74_SYMMI|nr:hypothetical protein AK812_SmicGene36693 [Symbiodinium microadriaticum]
MEGGGVVAKWDPDEDELVPDYASMPVVPEGSGSYPQGSQGMEDTQRVGKRTTHAAMDVDEPGGEVRINAAQGLTVEAVVQRQVLSIFQSQVTPLLGQLMDRLEAMEDGRAEEVKTSTAELQKLVINDGDKNVSPLLAGDWLTLAGLRLILKAIPNSLKEELVSTQRMSCIDAVAKAELEVLDTGVAKGTKAARLKGSEEQPKGDAGAAVGAAQTAAKVALAEGETYMGVSAFDTLIGSVDSDARSHMGYWILSYSLSGW